MVFLLRLKTIFGDAILYSMWQMHADTFSLEAEHTAVINNWFDNIQSYNLIEHDMQ